jgi:ATP-dependent RNA helicase RhlB
MVLDEADRMFDLGFIADIRYVLRKLPAATERLNLMFSATLSLRVLELAYEHMNEPTKLTVDAGTKTVARVTQSVYFPASDEKINLLLGLIATLKPTRGIIFVNTKYIAERIQGRLERAGLRIATLSGDVPQRKRLTLLDRFKNGTVELIVATDVAARGLHIPDVSHVFNFDLPFDAQDYVHRIGRTARFGSSGQAISFACEQYATSLPDIEAYIEASIPRASVTNELLTARPERQIAVGERAVVDGVTLANDAPVPKDSKHGGKPGGSKSAGRPGAGKPGGGRPGGARSGSARPGGGSGRSRSGGSSSAVSSAFIVKPGVNFSGASVPKPSGDAS